MKKLVFQISLFFLIAIILGACQEREELDFSEITFSEIENPDEVGKLTLRANVLNDLIVDSVGFMWSTALEEIDGVELGGHYAFIPQDDVVNGEFELILDDLSIDETYYFRAFAIDVDDEAGERLVFSPQIRSFNFNINLVMLDDAQIINNNAVVSAVLTGVQNATLSLVNHGFEYTVCCNAPCEVDASCFDSAEDFPIGSLNDDGIIQDTLKSLTFNTDYLVRAWAIKASGEKFYSNIVKIAIKDGWRQVSSLPISLTEAAAVSNGDFGFVTLGETEQEPGINTVYRFDPTNESWDVFETTPGLECLLLKTKSGIAFWIDNALHAGQGVFQLNEVLNGIGKFDITNNCWEQLNYPNELFGTRGALSFVIGEKAYIGLGSDYGFNTFYNNFWQYDPLDDSWVEVAPLPFKSSAGAPEELNRGRNEAVSFVYKGEAYVGSGFAAGHGRAGDFWKFITPDKAPPIGAWEYVGHFEGRDRAMAVAVVINDRVYFGTGEDAAVFTLNDWWEFIPETSEWIPRAPLPAYSRAQAVAFSAGNRGFVGSGTARLLGGNAFENVLQSDFWEYIPAQ